MRRRLLVLFAAAALGVGAASPVALAQDNGDTTEEDDGTDYGWIGLLGLAGLRRGHDEDSYHPAPIE